MELKCFAFSLFVIFLQLKTLKTASFDIANTTLTTFAINNSTSIPSVDHDDWNCTKNASIELCSSNKTTNSYHVLNDRKTLVFYYVTIILTVLIYACVLPSAYRKHQPSSVFIFALAIADSFIGLVIVPIKISEVYGSTWQKDIVACRAVNAITLFGIALASTNMVVVSVNRALYFAFPLKYQTKVTVKRALLASAFAYFLSLPALLPTVGIGGLTSDTELPFCAFKFSLSRAYMWCIGIAYYCCPSVIIFALQIDIMCRTKSYYQQHRDFIHNNPQNQQRQQQIQSSMKREMRIQKMFLAIIIMFFVCWSPFVVGIVCNLVAIHLITPFFIQLMRIMLFINSFVNPCIILFSNPSTIKFIHHVFRFFCCCCRDRMQNSQESQLEFTNLFNSRQTVVTTRSTISMEN